MPNVQRRLHAQRGRRAIRTRARLAGVSDRPRLVVSRSLKHTRAQVIEPKTGRVLAAATTQELKTRGTKTEAALAVGRTVAQRAVERSVTAVVFDRGAYRFHGRVKAVADGAREGGLKF